MSSGGSNNASGYAFNSLTDITTASDYTRLVKEKRVFKEDTQLPAPRKEIRQSYGYQLSFLQGKFKCGSCSGDAFNWK